MLLNSTKLAYLGISVRKSIFENPVYIGLDLACRNKTEVGPFGFDWAWFGFGGGGFLFIIMCLRGKA